MIINTISDFKKYISKDISGGIILICGRERKLIDESIRLIYSNVRDFPEINIITLESDSISIDSISNACETLPFMARYKIVHLKDFPAFGKPQKDTDDDQKQKKNKIGSDILNYLNEFSERHLDGILLLITINEEADERNKFVSNIKNSGAFVQYNPIKGEELYKWITEYFDRFGKEINRTEISYLVSMAGSTTEQLDKEIEKVCAYSLEDNIILKEHIDAVVHKNLESNIFKMIDCISKKDADGAVSMLDVLLAQKEKHLSILGMITRQYRLMLLSHEYQSEKMPAEKIGEKLKLKGYPLTNMLNVSRNYNEKNLKESLKKCLDTDFKIKSGIFTGDELDLSLELLIVELCR